MKILNLVLFDPEPRRVVPSVCRQRPATAAGRRARLAVKGDFNFLSVVAKETQNKARKWEGNTDDEEGNRQGEKK